MEYRQLGRSGLKVSVIGLGTNNFGNRDRWPFHVDAKGARRGALPGVAILFNRSRLRPTAYLETPESSRPRGPLPSQGVIAGPTADY